MLCAAQHDEEHIYFHMDGYRTSNAKMQCKYE
jgi:hypothetical protein